MEPKHDEEPVAVSATHYPDGLNANFLVEDAKMLEEKYGGDTGLFTNPETRDIARNVPQIMAALGDLTGLTIADIGAGTGLFLSPLDKAVGPGGRVYATELSPGFLKLLRELVAKEGLTSTTVVESTDTDTNIPADATIDLAVLIDVYHHVLKPVTFMSKLRAQVAPGGRLVVIDFHRDDSKIWSHPPGWVMEHVRADQQTFTNEILAAGWVLEKEVAIETLKENYFLVFTNPAAARAGGAS